MCEPDDVYFGQYEVQLTLAVSQILATILCVSHDVGQTSAALDVVNQVERT